MRQLVSSAIVAVLTVIGTTALAAQQDVPDSVMGVLRTTAVGCKVQEVRRFGSDSVVVTLLDPTLELVSFEAAEWVLCGNTSGDLTSRELGRAVVGPLWTAWAPKVAIQLAIVVARGPGADSARVRLAYSRPNVPPPSNRSTVVPNERLLPSRPGRFGRRDVFSL